VWYLKIAIVVAGFFLVSLCLMLLGNYVAERLAINVDISYIEAMLAIAASWIGVAPLAALAIKKKAKKTE
jgi:positive regulator of sigma E activity